MSENLGYVINFAPTVVWILLTIVGLAYGYKEVKESLEDYNAVEADRLDHVPFDEDPRVDVAQGNFSTAWKNMATQSVFLLVGMLSVFLRIYFYSEFEQVNVIRAVIVPAIIVIGEAFLVSQVISMSRIRENVKTKARKILLDKQRADNLIQSDPNNKKVFEEKIAQDRLNDEERITSQRTENEKRISDERKDNEERIDKERREQ